MRPMKDCRALHPAGPISFDAKSSPPMPGMRANTPGPNPGRTQEVAMSAPRGARSAKSVGPFRIVKRYVPAFVSISNQSTSRTNPTPSAPHRHRPYDEPCIMLPHTPEGPPPSHRSAVTSFSGGNANPRISTFARQTSV